MAEHHEAAVAMIEAMDAAGIGPAESIINELLSGALVRFPITGDRPGKKNGWAILHADDFPAGAFGSHKHGVSATWRADCGRRRRSQAEREIDRLRFKELRDQRRQGREAAQASARDEAVKLWNAGRDADPDHAYLREKRIINEGVRQHRNYLLVPMRDIDGDLWNVQRIWPDKTKLYLKGGRVDGLMWSCGDPDAAIVIGEGFGTCAAVRRATGLAVAAAFTWKNLEPVARLIHGRWPDLDKIFAADDDAHLVDHPTIKRNIGLEAAHAAAAVVGGRVALPPKGDA